MAQQLRLWWRLQPRCWWQSGRLQVWGGVASGYRCNPSPTFVGADNGDSYASLPCWRHHWCGLRVLARDVPRETPDLGLNHPGLSNCDEQHRSPREYRFWSKCWLEGWRGVVRIASTTVGIGGAAPQGLSGRRVCTQGGGTAWHHGGIISKISEIYADLNHEDFSAVRWWWWTLHRVHEMPTKSLLNRMSALYSPKGHLGVRHVPSF
jgi:hypothetical protein